MNVAERFAIGLVELGERHNQMHRAEYYKPKNMNPNQQQDSTTMDTNSTKQLKNKNCGSKAYRTVKSV
jgi:hypothetical protein